MGWLIGGLAVGAVMLGLVIAAYAVGHQRGEDAARRSAGQPTATTPAETTPTETTQTTTAPATTPKHDVVAAGKEIFASGGCGGCHTLSDAGATGTVGPNLDNAKPSLQLAVDRVTNGLGAMPSFKGQLSSAEIQAVATYVSQTAGG